MTRDDVLKLVRLHLADQDREFRAMVSDLSKREAQSGKVEFSAKLDWALKSYPPRSSRAVPMMVDSPCVQVDPTVRLSEVHLEGTTRSEIAGFIAEHRARERLEDAGLTPARRLLFVGPPGNGKTMSAEALANELEMPFFLVKLDGIVDSLLGQSAANLAKVFLFMSCNPGLYFFDEIDSIAASRSIGGESGGVGGEMRRLVNQFLMLLDRDRSRSVIAGATNMGDMLDPAFVRRFDLVIDFPRPSETAKKEFFKRIAGTYSKDRLEDVAVHCDSYCDIKAAVMKKAKTAVIEGRALGALDFAGGLA